MLNKKRLLAFGSGTLAFLLGGKAASEYLTLRQDGKSNFSPLDMVTTTGDDYLDYALSDAHVQELSYRKTLGSSYVYLAQAKDESISNYGIYKLAHLEGLTDFEYLKIAQQIALNYDVSVKLARTKGVSSKLFLEPPIQCLKAAFTGNRTEFMLNLLDQVKKEVPSVSPCTRYFAMMAHKVNDEREYLGLDHEDLLAERARKKRYTSPERVDWLCLQALLGYCTGSEDASKVLAEHGIFLALHLIRQQYKRDREMMACVASILGKLSEHPSLSKHFLQTQWFRTLVEWVNDEEIELSIPATKCLYNLDKNVNVTLRQSLYLLSPAHRNLPAQFDIVFVHGLVGCMYRTWRQDEANRGCKNYTRCWPKSWLPQDVNNLRILCVDYSTYLSDWNVECPVEKLSLERRSKSIMEDLVAAGVGTRPVIWVAHSMGGLLVKQILTFCKNADSSHLKNMVKNTKGIIFYSVPHRGSVLSTWPSRLQLLVLPSPEVRELLKDSPSLLSLHESFLKIVQEENIQCLSFAETHKSRLGVGKLKLNLMMVTPESANPGVGEFIVLPTDHLHTCKPFDKDSVSYQTVLNFIKKTLSQ